MYEISLKIANVFQLMSNNNFFTLKSKSQFYNPHNKTKLNRQTKVIKKVVKGS